MMLFLPSPTPNTEGKLVSASSVFTTGIFIKSVVVDSPAARTGMATGDRIVQVGAVRNKRQLCLFPLEYHYSNNVPTAFPLLDGSFGIFQFSYFFRLNNLSSLALKEEGFLISGPKTTCNLF